jgi:Bacterial PH domain
MSAEYEIEPIRGLPGDLPAGEHIIWQGAPNWVRLARDAFKTRWVAVYFAVFLLWAIFDGNATGAAMTLFVGLIAMVLLHGLAWLAARATVYTITNRRVVFRFGVALPKCVNLPMSAIASVGLKRNADGTGDIPLALSGAHRLGYVQFWPHARPWKVGAPEPMLRALPDAYNVAALLSAAMLAEIPTGRRAVVTDGIDTTAKPNGAFAAA